MELLSFKDWLYKEGFEDEPYAFHAVFMAGGPASGKTTIAKAMFQGLGFQFSSADHFYERLSAKKGFDANAEGGNFTSHPDHPIATQTRAQSTKLAIKQGKSWQDMRYPIVIDVTGRDKDGVAKIDDNLKKIGYDTFMVFVNTDLDKAVQRNTVRGQGGGYSTIVPRAAGPEETEKFWHQVQANKSFFHQVFGDNYVEVDNSEDLQVPSTEFRQKQTNLVRIAMKLLGPKGVVKNPIGAAMLAQGTNYYAMANKQPQPQPQPYYFGWKQPQLGVA